MKRVQCLPEIPAAADSNGTNAPVVLYRQTSSRALIATGADHVASPAAIKVTGNVVVDYHIRSSIEGWILPRWREL